MQSPPPESTRREDTPSSPRRHLLIAGTGRAGTTLLVRILDACGMETELSRDPQAWWDDNARAGLESAPFATLDLPYLIKSPWSYQFLRQLLADRAIALDGLIIPIRPIAEAAASRVILELRHIHDRFPETDGAGVWRSWGTVPGGMTYSLEPLDQARMLSHSLHLLIEAAVEFEVPIRFLSFPRFASDPAYLYDALGTFLPSGLGRSDFVDRVGKLVSDDDIRVGKEMAAAVVHGAGEVPARDAGGELPTIDALDGIALRRETKRLREQLVKVREGEVAQIARIAELEAALGESRRGLETLHADVHRHIGYLEANLEACRAKEAEARQDGANLTIARDAARHERDLAIAAHGQLDAERERIADTLARSNARNDELLRSLGRMDEQLVASGSAENRGSPD